MATKTWTGSVSTDWNDPNNWDPPGVPGGFDDVVIGTTATSPILGTTTTLNSLAINGLDTLTLTNPSAFLIVTNGISLDSTGGISGVGTVTANITATGAATIAANGGTLRIVGDLNDTGDALTLSLTAAGDRLAHFPPGDFISHSSVHTANIDTVVGTLELSAKTYLTVATTMTIGDSTVQLDSQTDGFVQYGALLIDAAGVTIDDGTIIGGGQVLASVTVTGAANIIALNAYLRVHGTLTDSADALSLTIMGDAAVLELSGDTAARIR